MTDKKFIRVTADIGGALVPVLVNRDIITTVGPAEDAVGRSVIKTSAIALTTNGAVPLDILVANSIDQIAHKLDGSGE